MSRPETPLLTVDAIIEVSPGKIVLIERKNPPYGWAIPGGFVDIGEKVIEAVKREAKEETGLDIYDIKLFGVFSDPSRDPRGHTVSIVFTAKADGEPVGADDALRAKVFELNKLPEKIAFDHAKILDYYKKCPSCLVVD